ncbi:PREDICTED: melanoma-associated antigen B5-like [Galeopterus variegatus]|uniref:Melanoma-associated antigen B5-like n=1 Tax=Galeopterus variegatus TaxID=482537 RepID=A0ABM0Q443_GALVR|nr:PREDICTED: melanoma-associated antigen B5-like [Galeopterus variegatus]
MERWLHHQPSCQHSFPLSLTRVIMPRRRKSKRHASEKSAQATAAAAEESPPSSSLCGENTQSLPAAGSCSSSEGPQRAPSTTTTSEGISCTRSEAGFSGQGDERKSTSEDPLSTDNSGEDPLMRKSVLLAQFLLYKFRMKQPIMKADMLKVISRKYKHQFADILKRASQHVEAAFAVEVVEVDSSSHSYNLVSKLKLPNNGRVRPGRGFPKTGLLMLLLGVILTNGNCATEEHIWKCLNKMKVYAGRKHFIYGEPRKLITQDLVRLNYLEYQQVPNSDPPCYQFLWGPRARVETSETKVLEHFGNMKEVISCDDLCHYVEPLEDEEERGPAIDPARHGICKCEYSLLDLLYSISSDPY